MAVDDSAQILPEIDPKEIYKLVSHRFIICNPK